MPANPLPPAPNGTEPISAATGARLGMLIVYDEDEHYVCHIRGEGEDVAIDCHGRPVPAWLAALAAPGAIAATP